MRSGKNISDAEVDTRYRRGSLDIAAADDFVFAAGDPGDGFAVGDVLFGENAIGERVGVVGFEHGNGALQHDDAVVEVLVDKMNRAAGDLDAVVEGLGLRFEAGKGRQKRGVDVENAVGVGGDELRGEQAHVAGQADEVDAVRAQAGENVGVVFGAGAALGDKERVVQAEIAGGGEAGSIGDVGDDDGDFDAGQAAFADRSGDGEEIGSAAGEKNAEAKGPGWVGMSIRQRVSELAVSQGSDS